MRNSLSNRPHLQLNDLDSIRHTVDWRALFTGLGLRKAEQKSKAEDWWAFSPFHEEQTPSFHMGPLGIWYDFSIGEGGGSFELIQKLYGLNCYEAASYLCERGWAQFPAESQMLPAPKETPVIQEKADVRQQVTAISEIKHPYGDIEITSPNMPIRQDLLPLCAPHPWLKERGIQDTTAQQLGIGFLSQGRSALKGRIIFQIRDAQYDAQTQQYQPVILSHLGRAIEENTSNKYLFYRGFQKAAALYGQERFYLNPTAIEQAQQHQQMLLTEGTMDVAKAIEGGVENILASFGATLSNWQAQKIKQICMGLKLKQVLIVYDRDQAGKSGAQKAKTRLESIGIKAQIFDWEAAIAQRNQSPIYLPQNIQDLADFSAEQLRWLRQHSHL